MKLVKSRVPGYGYMAVYGYEEPKPKDHEGVCHLIDEGGDAFLAACTATVLRGALKGFTRGVCGAHVFFGLWEENGQLRYGRCWVDCYGGRYSADCEDCEKIVKAELAAREERAARRKGRAA